MIGQEWEVVVHEVPDAWRVKVFLITRRGNQVFCANLKDGMIEEIEIKEGQEFKPTLDINRDIWKALKSSLLDKQVREKSTVESELKATSYHLEDMRKLVFQEPIIMEKKV